MTVRGVSNPLSFEGAQKTKGTGRKGAAERFGEGFSLENQKAGEEDGNTQRISGLKTEETYRYMKNVPVSIHEAVRIRPDSAAETTVRNISYSESDKVQVDILEGYTMKAKADRAGGFVYVELKMEDGEKYAYEIDPDQIQADTKNPVEKMALEAWEKAKSVDFRENSSLFHSSQLIRPEVRETKGTIVGGCFASGLDQGCGDIYLGEWGDACIKAVKSGKAPADFYEQKGKTAVPEGIAIKLSTGRNVYIDFDRLSDLNELRAVLTPEEYLQAANAVSKVLNGGARQSTKLALMSGEEWEKLLEKVDTAIAALKQEVEALKEYQKEKTEEEKEKTKKALEKEINKKLLEDIKY